MITDIQQAEKRRETRKKILQWVLAPFLGLFFAMSANLLFYIFALTETDPVVSEISLPVLILIEVVVAPFLEELLFRRLLFTALAGRIGALFASLLSSLIFAILHFQWLQGIYAFLFGLLLCLLLDGSGKWWICVFCHAAANLVSIAMNELTVVNEWITRYAAISFVASFVLLLAGTFLFATISRRYSPAEKRS